jgi:ABC-type branched-subunit amino acid transport system permease subunit
MYASFLRISRALHLDIFPHPAQQRFFSSLIEGNMKARYFTGIIVAIISLIFPLVIRSDYYQHLVIIALIWVIVGAAWNLLAGYTGQVSFGHAMFFGTGAYTAGILATKLGLSAWWGMAFGGIVAMIVALFVGWVCFRLRGPYFALATLAGGEIFRLVATNWEDLTEGMVVYSSCRPSGASFPITISHSCSPPYVFMSFMWS